MMKSLPKEPVKVGNKKQERLELAKFMIQSSNKNSTSILNPNGTIATAQDIANRANERFNDPRVKKMIDDLIKS